MQGIGSLLRFKPGEGRRTLILFLLNFCVVAVTIAGKSARDTFFLSRYNKSYLPLMFVACAVMVALASSLYGRASGKISRSTLFNLTSLAFAGIVVLLGMHIAGFVIPAFYAWIEIVVSITTMQLWMLASDTFDPRQAKRLFGIIGGGGSLAAAIVGTGLKPFVHQFGPNTLLTLIAVVLVIYWLLGRLALRNLSPVAAAPKPRPGAKPTKKLDPYLAAIAAVIGLSAIVSQLVDYQFKIIASQSFTDERDLAGFFGHFYAATGVASLLVQFFLTSTILSRFGLLAGLLALPVALNVGTLAILFNPKLWSGVLAKFSDQTFKFTLSNSSMELLWLPVRPDRRKAVRPLISGTIKSICEVFAGLLMFVLVKLFAPRYLGFVSIAAIAIWIVVIIRLKSLYVKTLITAIEKRQIDFEGLNLDAQDPAMIAVIDKALASEDEGQRFSALELMEGLPLRPWEARLKTLFEEGSPEVKNRLISLAADDEKVLPDERLVRAIDEDPAVAASAMRLAGSRKIRAALPHLTEQLESSVPSNRAAAATAILQMGEGPADRARQTLTAMLDDPRPAARSAVLDCAGDSPAIVSQAHLQRLLLDHAHTVRAIAIRQTGARAEVALLPPLVANLVDARLAAGVRKALSSFPPDDVLHELAQALETRSLAPNALVRALGDTDSTRSVEVLLRHLSGTGVELASPVALSLRRIGLRHTLPPEALERSAQVSESLIKYAYTSNRLLQLLPEGPPEFLLREHHENEIREAVGAILRLRGLELPPRAAEEMLFVVRSGDAARLPYVLELLENLLDREHREMLAGLLDAMPVAARDALGARQFKDLPTEIDGELASGCRSRRPWVSAICLDYVKRTGRDQLFESLDLKQLAESPLRDEILCAGEAGDTMYSTLEKTILLKSVSLFREIPAEKLSQIAQIAEETHWAAGSVILREGEPGDSLYIIAVGSVSIHKGEMKLTTFKKGDCLGEMAVLDHSPRSADATALEDSTLLKITQEDFYEVLSANPEITEGIIRLLSRRLRESNERLAAKS